MDETVEVVGGTTQSERLGQFVLVAYHRSETRLAQAQLADLVTQCSGRAVFVHGSALGPNQEDLPGFARVVLKVTGTGDEPRRFAGLLATTLIREPKYDKKFFAMTADKYYATGPTVANILAGNSVWANPRLWLTWTKGAMVMPTRLDNYRVDLESVVGAEGDMAGRLHALKLVATAFSFEEGRTRQGKDVSRRRGPQEPAVWAVYCEGCQYFQWLKDRFKRPVQAASWDPFRTAAVNREGEYVFLVGMPQHTKF